MKPVGFIAGRNGVVGDKRWCALGKALRSLFRTGQVCFVRAFEETSGMAVLASGIVVFDGKEPVAGRAGLVAWVGVDMAALGTGATIALRGAVQFERGMAVLAVPEFLQRDDLVQFPTRGAHKHVSGMPFVFGNQIARKEVELPGTLRTREDFDPQKVFDRKVLGAIVRTARGVVSLKLIPKCAEKRGGGRQVAVHIQRFDLFFDNPGHHRVDIDSQDVTAKAIGLNQRSAAAHEGIGHSASAKAVGLVVGSGNRLRTELRQQERPKQRSRPTCKPLMGCDDGPVVLLDLLFAKGQGRYKGDIKVFFYTHAVMSEDTRLPTMDNPLRFNLTVSQMMGNCTLEAWPKIIKPLAEYQGVRGRRYSVSRPIT